MISRIGFVLLHFVLLASAPAAERVSLFDGQTLNGWEGNTSVWRVRDGVIVGGSLEGNPQNEFLATRQRYRHFSLRFEYKLTGTEGFVNGGVQFRSRRIPDPPNEMSGYQADIGAGFSGALYDESRRRKTLAQPLKSLIESVEKPGDWNRGEIICEGPRIRLLVNGRVTVDYVEREPGIDEDGVIALQIHGKCKAEIAFRRITIEAFPDTLLPSPTDTLKRFGDGGAARGRISPWENARFTLGSDEVLVFAGQENLVRAQRSGALETQLALGFAPQRPRIRSMAWEADTVYEQWREANFGSWSDQLRSAGATIVFAQFGQLEALDGPSRLSEFSSAYHRLLDHFTLATPRLVLLSPTPFENAASANAPLAPDLSQRNADLKVYVDAIRDIARQRGLAFIDLFTPLVSRPAGAARLTDNGLHLNADGLRVVSALLIRQLGISPSRTIAGDALQQAIAAKNRLWFDCWRPANWSFVYGNRVTQMFGKPSGRAPSLHVTFEQHKPMIAALDARIHALALGEPAPPAPSPADALAQKPLTLSPEEELATFTVADGFKVELVASERNGIVKPTQLSWDERGRLYVACSPTYPHPLPGVQPGDYILMLEDADGDGRFETSRRFLEGLTMVQGMEPADGGMYVCDFDQLLHVRDLDGDGRAEQRRVVFSGFGIGDTHQLINSIQHGPDGTLWFSQGHHAFSRVETPWGIARLDGSALWRFHPRTLQLEGFFNNSKAGHNLWSVAFDDYNQMFHKSADRVDGYYSQPGLVANLREFDEYHGVGNLFATNPKTTALDIIGTRAMPDELQGCAVIGGYFGNVVELHRFKDDGAGFVSEQLPKLVRSTSKSFRPVDVSVGPDGAIYVADWFNPIIGHYQASYADPERDRSHGRIWRIVAKDRAPIKPPVLAGRSIASLLDELRSPERWTRYQAKRLLFDAPSREVVAATDAWLDKFPTDDPAYERILLAAIGLFEAHHAVRSERLKRLLASSDPRIRAYGTRVIGNWSSQLPDAADLLRARIHDSHPRVRLEAIVASSYLPRPETVTIAVQSIDHERDRFIDYALAQVIRSLEPQWRPAFTAGKLVFAQPAHADYLRKIATAVPPAVHPGKAVYDALCLNCHQADAKGLPGIYPPLAGSEWINGSPDVLIRILLHGLTGPVKVAGQSYGTTAAIPMPPMGLDDRQTADVLTYLRRSFGNNSAPIASDEVGRVRASNAGRATMWTQDELNSAGR